MSDEHPLDPPLFQYTMSQENGQIFWFASFMFGHFMFTLLVGPKESLFRVASQKKSSNRTVLRKNFLTHRPLPF